MPLSGTVNNMLMSREAGITEMLQLLEQMYIKMRDEIIVNRTGLVEFDNGKEEDVPASCSIRALTQEGYADTKMFFGYVKAD